MNSTLSNSHPRPRHLRVASTALAMFLLVGFTSSRGGRISGTYESKTPDGTMTIEFKSGGKAHLTMRPSGGQPDNFDGDYMMDGNKVTVQVSGGMPLVLVRNGRTLDANMMGQILHFTKK